MAKNGATVFYNADPKKDKTAVKFEELTHRDVSIRCSYHGLNCSTLSMDNDIDLVVFNMNQPRQHQTCRIWWKYQRQQFQTYREERNKKIIVNAIVEKAKNGPVS